MRLSETRRLAELDELKHKLFENGETPADRRQWPRWRRDSRARDLRYYRLLVADKIRVRRSLMKKKASAPT